MYIVTVLNADGVVIKQYLYPSRERAWKAVETLYWQYMVGQKYVIKIEEQRIHNLA
jgi:hypothetical protein